MKNKKLNNQILLFVITTVTLILMFYFKFEIRRLVSTNLHFYTHILIFVLFSVNIYLSILIGIKLKIKNFLKPIIIIGYVIVFVYTLTHIYSSQRKVEMTNFLIKNENKLQKIVELFLNNNSYSDGLLHSLHKEVNIGSCTCNWDKNGNASKNIVFLPMFVFLGYGYGIAYSEKYETQKPSSYHMSPMRDWYRIKDNWFYYEYND